MTNCAVCFGKRLMKHDLCEVITLELITQDKNTKFQVGLTINYQYSNECSYTKIQTVERWQIALYVSKTAHETWILKRHNVRAHSLRNYTIFQFGLQIQLAIISTQKPNTKTHMTYRRLIALCVLINGSRSMDFTKSCRSSSYPKKIANFQVALLIQQTIFHTKSKY